MKLTVEVTQDSFIYSYEVGENKHTSTCHVSAEMLCAFTELLKVCTNVTRFDSREWERKAMREEIEREVRKELSK